MKSYAEPAVAHWEPAGVVREWTGRSGIAFMELKVHSHYKPQGDQASAIEQLTRGLSEGEKHQVLLGVTGSGKTFTMAKVIEECSVRRW